MPTQNRLEHIRQSLRAAEATALLVTTPANVRYVSGFGSPDDAVVLITEDAAVLLTDGRYTAQAAEQSRLPFEIVTGLHEAAAERAAGTKLAVEADSLTVAQYRKLAAKLGYEPVALEAVFAKARMVKSEDELAKLREAARIADLAFEAAVAMMRPGVREVEVALELERSMRLAGAEGSAFEIIVASGVRGAMPHGAASQKELAVGELVTLDFGAVVDGYHSDMTRTVAIGEVGAEERRLFDAVLEAQTAALAAVGPGKTGKELDAVARHPGRARPGGAVQPQPGPRHRARHPRGPAPVEPQRRCSGSRHGRYGRTRRLLPRLHRPPHRRPGRRHRDRP